LPVFHNDPDPVNPRARAPVAVGLGWRAKTAMVVLGTRLSRGTSCKRRFVTAAGQNGGERQLFDIGTDLREDTEVPFKIKNK
jgi:hypothetical protein